MTGSHDSVAEVIDARPNWLLGTVDEVAEQLQALEAAGVSRVMLQHLDHADTEMVAVLGEVAASMDTTPDPVRPGGRPRLRTFRSLGVRNFRLFLFGHLVSSTGTWMQQVGQDWLVLRLTDAPLPLGITLALQFAPMLVLGAWAGLVADRVDKRRLLLATQTAMAMLALVLGVLTATGAVRLWMVYALALLLGWPPPSTCRPGRRSSARWSGPTGSPTPSG